MKTNSDIVSASSSLVAFQDGECCNSKIPRWQSRYGVRLQELSESQSKQESTSASYHLCGWAIPAPLAQVWHKYNSKLAHKTKEKCNPSFLGEQAFIKETISFLQQNKTEVILKIYKILVFSNCRTKCLQQIQDQYWKNSRDYISSKIKHDFVMLNIVFIL